MVKCVTLATGTRVSFHKGAPTAEDMAIALSRIPRFSGNGWLFFPVVLHSFIVADLLPDSLKWYGLIHDGAECAGNDVPKPFKTPWTKRFESRLFERTCSRYGIALPTRSELVVLKSADVASLNAEAWTVGPPKPAINFRRRYPEVEQLVKRYAREYPPLELVRRNGAAPREFLRRFRLYHKLASDKLV